MLNIKSTKTYAKQNIHRRKGIHVNRQKDMSGMNVHTFKWAPLQTRLPGDIAVSGTPPLPFILTARTSLEGPSHLSMFSPPHHNPPSPPHTQAGRQTHSRPKVPLVLKGRRKEKRWTGISSIPPLPYPSTKGVHDSPGLKQQGRGRPGGGCEPGCGCGGRSVWWMVDW